MQEHPGPRVERGFLAAYRLFDVAYAIDLAQVERLAGGRAPTARLRLARTSAKARGAGAHLRSSAAWGRAHLGRAAGLFRVRVWNAAVERKLAIMRDTYTALYDDAATARAELLELAIVLLIIFEIIWALLGG